MKEGILSYWSSLVYDIPHELYIISFVVLILYWVVCVGLKGIVQGTRFTMRVLLIEYIGLLYCSTVFYRITSRSVQFDYHPFWSYQAYFDGREPNALIENIMNILVFVPIGVLLGYLIKNKAFVRVSILGAYISIGIELLQLIFKKGFSELDDVMHNMLGCVIGFGLCKIANTLWHKRRIVIHKE